MFGPFGGIGMTELIIVLVIVLIFFGAKRLPGIGTGLGKGIGDFKKAVSGDLKEDTASEEPEQLSDDNSPKDENDAEGPGDL